VLSSAFTAGSWGRASLGTSGNAHQVADGIVRKGLRAA